MRPHQVEFYAAVWAFLRGESKSRKFYADAHRRFGKSFILFLIAVEIGLGKAAELWPSLRRLIRFAAPTLLDLEEVYQPISEELFEDCPPEILPRWKSSFGRGCWTFPSTGARLYLFGVDKDNYRKGRGKRLEFGVVDESGFTEPSHSGGIRHVVNSILLPQTFGVNGRIVIATTPAETPAHPTTQLKAQCKAIPGAYVRFDIEKTKHYFGQAVVDEYARECGGYDSADFQREYLCMDVVDTARAIIPDYTFAADTDLVASVPAVGWHYPLLAMDVGFEDLHFILAGYWDFRRAKLCVQGEVALQRATTDRIADGIRSLEARLWTGARREREVVRWTDVDPRLVADLGLEHRLAVVQTAKDDLEAQVNAVRMLVKARKLQIDPSCELLRKTLLQGIWNKQRTSFERLPGIGHSDAIAALIYMTRNANRSENPYPAVEEGVSLATHHIPVSLQGARQSSVTQALSEAFVRRRR